MPTRRRRTTGVDRRTRVGGGRFMLIVCRLADPARNRPPGHATMLNRLFRLDQHRTTARREIVAGVTTYMTMAYVAVVNPQILGEAGMDRGAVFVATCLSAAIASAAMGLYANYPIALAPGMGINAFFTYGVVLGMGASLAGGPGRAVHLRHLLRRHFHVADPDLDDGRLSPFAQDGHGGRYRVLAGAHRDEERRTRRDERRDSRRAWGREVLERRARDLRAGAHRGPRCPEEGRSSADRHPRGHRDRSAGRRSELAGRGLGRSPRWRRRSVSSTSAPRSTPRSSASSSPSCSPISSTRRAR